MPFKPLLAPNGTILHTQESIQALQGGLMSARAVARRAGYKETADDEGYALPVPQGSSPPGLGYTFEDSFRRTGRDVMDFNLPTGQTATINTALKYAFENMFIAKGLRIKTDFTCKGLTNRTSDPRANKFFDDVYNDLNVLDLYRQAVWLYYSVGLVPILFPEPDEDFNYIDILDPRMVRVFKMFGKQRAFIVPDLRMINACKDPNGTSNQINQIVYSMLPPRWRTQIRQGLEINPYYNPSTVGMSGEMLIELTPGSFSIIENRDNMFSRNPGEWDGCPLQPYFAEAEHFRQLMAGDFASGFVSKNLIALVSVGDPAAEGANYIRPDQPTINGLSASFLTPNRATWMFGDPTTKIQYITPDPNTWTSEKYKVPLEVLKNILPSPFWFDGGGSYSSSSVEIKTLIEETGNCNDRFDRKFFAIINQRAAASSSLKIAQKNIIPPVHDKNSFIDDQIFLQKLNQTYQNGGMSIRTFLEENGYDYDVERQRMLDQEDDVKKGIWMPAFEAKQGIVAAFDYGVPNKPGEATTPSIPSNNADVVKAQQKQNGGTGGRPQTAGSTPKAEPGAARAPRAKGS